MQDLLEAAPVSKPGEENSPRADDAGTFAAVYERLVMDPSISHGAFRLWHLLRSKYANARGLAWPGQRRIAKDLGCDPHSIKGWTSQLVAGGYLRVEEYDPDRHPEVSGKSEGFVYRLRVTPNEALHNSTTPRCGKPQQGVVENHRGGDAGLPLGGVVETCNETKPKEPSPRNQEGARGAARTGSSLPGLAAPPTAANRFSPPTESEARFEADKLGLPAREADKFLAYFQANGWRTGRTRMRDWRAAMRTWKLRWEEGGRTSSTTRGTYENHRAINHRNAGTY